MKDFLLNLFFPKRCVGCKKFGSYICPSCFASIQFVTNFTCASCHKGSIDGAVHPVCRTKYGIDGVSSGVIYKGVVKRLLYQFKYKPYLSDLKNVMSELLYEGLIQNEAFYNLLNLKPVIFCVPLHAKKFRQRGYNHAALLAKIIAFKFNIQFIDNVLIRTKITKPQFDLNKEERIKNIKGAFLLNEKYKEVVKNQNVFLIDDLATSFTTLSECAKVLKHSGAKLVWGVTFAREE